MRKNIQITFKDEYIPVLANFNTPTVLKLDVTRSVKAVIRARIAGQSFRIELPECIKEAAKHRNPPLSYTIPLSDEDFDIEAFYYSLPRGTRESVIGDLLTEALTTPKKPKPTAADYAKFAVDSTEPYPFDDYTHTSIAGIGFDGNRISVEEWGDAFPTVCNLLAEKCSEQFDMVIKRGKAGDMGNTYLSRESHDAEKMVKLTNANGYANRRFGATWFYRITKELLEELGLPETIVQIYLKADRRRMHQKK